MKQLRQKTIDAISATAIFIVMIMGNSQSVFAQFTFNGDYDRTFAAPNGYFVDGQFPTGGAELNTYFVGGVLAENGSVVAGGGTSMQGGAGGALDFYLKKFTSSGALDTSFGGGTGFVVTDFFTAPPGGSNSLDTPYVIKRQTDGRIVIAGSCNVSGPANVSISFGRDVCFVRYNTDGSLDTSFGNSIVRVSGPGGANTQQWLIGPGKAIFQTGLDDAGNLGGKNGYIYDMLIQPDGKILAVGETRDEPSLRNVGIIMRLNGDGSLDTTFGTNGIARFVGVNTGTASSPCFPQRRFYGISLQSDGRILAVGQDGVNDANCFQGTAFVVTRWSGDGQLQTVKLLDNSATIFSRERATAALLTGDKVLVSGGFQRRWTLARLNLSDLSVDTTFGINGVSAYGPVNDQFLSIKAIQPDGKILGVDSANNATLNSVVRFNADGSGDQSFGNASWQGDTGPQRGRLDPLRVLLNGNNEGFTQSNLVVRPDGKINIFGYKGSFFSSAGIRAVVSQQNTQQTTTPTGSNVTVTSGNASVTFAQVTNAGTTTFTPIDPNSAGAPPSGYSICPSCPAYDITTTATYTPPITVCLNVPASIDQQTFSAMKLLHGEGGVLVDRTTSGVTNPDGTRKVCGSVQSLSSFVLAQGPTATPTIQFSLTNYSVNKVDGRATITVTRSGDTSGSATVDYRTTDTDTFTLSCADPAKRGSAWGRCDYVTTLGTLAFAAGEASKTFSIPIINDSYADGNETFSVVLSNPTGASLGSPATATVTIINNDTVNGPNPMLRTDDVGIAFFVRQDYLDFLGREPEVGEPWSAILRGCANQFNTDPASPSAGCDRITVSGSFFGSPEFKDKGVYLIVFYRVAFNRLPQYAEFSPDLASLAGATAAEANAKRAAFANNFVLRPEFVNAYAAMTNSTYVTALMTGSMGQGYNLTSITTPDPANPDGTTKVTLTTNDLINRLNASTLTRAQVLRAIVQSDQVRGNLEAVNAFVASQYYGYLRRTPDTSGFNSWVTYLKNNPSDFRTMVNGFVNSTEYRLRFGPP